MHVLVRSDGIGRYPQEVEATAYFCVLEALQNASKYAEATSVEIGLMANDGWLSFEVVDNGRGFDPNSTPKKLTALGRFKHENAAIALADDKRVVVYMGDDQASEYIYKFVSDGKYDPDTPALNRLLDLADAGTRQLFALQRGLVGQYLDKPRSA